MVGSVISSYLPGDNDIAFIASAEPLTVDLVAAQSKRSQPTSARRFNLITLLKLPTFQILAQYRWSQDYFSHLVINNWIKLALSIKNGTSKFSISQTLMYLQDIWPFPIATEAFGICVRGPVFGVDLLSHPSSITPAELIDLFRQI